MGAHTEEVYSIMERVGIATKHQVADVMAHWGIWTKGISAVNNTYKELNNLVEDGRLIKENNYFKLSHIKSEFKGHAEFLTTGSCTILKFNRECRVFREKTIDIKGLRPDAIVLMVKNDQRCAFIYEAVVNESENYLSSKRNVWAAWPEATAYLTELFNEPIKHFDFVTSNDLKTYLEGL